MNPNNRIKDVPAEQQRKIAIPDFYGKGSHIYEDEMGFTLSIRTELNSNVMSDIFLYALGELYYEMGFYYAVNETFYFIATMEFPFQVLKLPRNLAYSQYIGWQCDVSAYEFGEVIATYDTVEEIWNDFKIDGKGLEEIIPHSYIMQFG